jgi:hypothetical protein
VKRNGWKLEAENVLRMWNFGTALGMREVGFGLKLDSLFFSE